MIFTVDFVQELFYLSKNMNMVFLDYYLHCFKIYHFRPRCLVSYFLFGVLGMKWNSYVSVPDFCHFIYYHAIMREFKN